MGQQKRKSDCFRFSESGVLTISGKGVLDQEALRACGAGNLFDEGKKIGVEAFLGCENLTSVTIPNPDTVIGSGAFEEGVTIQQ